MYSGFSAVSFAIVSCAKPHLFLVFFTIFTDMFGYYHIGGCAQIKHQIIVKIAEYFLLV